MTPIIQTVKTKFSELVSKQNLGNRRMQVTVKTLSPKQAIGSPARQDFPILLGREVIVEAQLDESFGQAFTDRPQSFDGTIDELLNLNLNSSSNRAIFIASLNAVTVYLGIASGTRHCRDEEPEMCARQIAGDLKGRFSNAKVGLIGMQPAILQNLSQSFGAENVACTDLNPNNIGSHKFGVEIWNGANDTDKLINHCDLILVTSSSLTNGTFDDIHKTVSSTGKSMILFGITGAGICALIGLERICFYGH